MRFFFGKGSFLYRNFIFLMVFIGSFLVLSGFFSQIEASVASLELKSVNGVSNKSEIHKNEKIVYLATRSFVPATDKTKYDTELDSKYVTGREKIDLNKTALVLIDIWKTHPDDGFLKRQRKHTEKKIVPLLAAARKNNVMIIHAPHGQEIAPEVAPLPNEMVLSVEQSTSSQFDKLLKEKGIDTLLYAGYASNWCLFLRPVGILFMHQLLYKAIPIRDGTIAFETPKTFKGEWANEVVMNMAENVCEMSTSVDDVIQALDSPKNIVPKDLEPAKT